MKTLAWDLGFESQTCSRCGGSGRYSFNQMDGDRCYGCGGRGIQLTKRGKVAFQSYKDSLSVGIEDIKVGMRVYSEPGPMWAGGWGIVESVGPDPLNAGYIQFTTATFSYGSKPEFTTRLRVAHEPEVMQQKLAEALALQATLTKTGTVKKAK